MADGPSHGVVVRVRASVTTEIWFVSRSAKKPLGARRAEAVDEAVIAWALRREPGLTHTLVAGIARGRGRAGSRPSMTGGDMVGEVLGALRDHTIEAWFVTRPVDDLFVPKHEAEPPKPVDKKEATDFIDVLLTNGLDHPFEDEPYELTLPGGEVIKDKLDGKGRLKKDGVPFGSFTLEFPNLFGMTIFRDDVRISDDGRGTPPALPAPPDYAHPDLNPEYTYEDEDGDELDHPLASDAGALWPDPFDGPGLRERSETERTEQRGVELADLSGMTGCKYHLAVLYCVSLRLVDEKTGEWVRGRVPYRLKESGGKMVGSGESEDGIVFHDETAMGDFVLEIRGKKIPVVATPHAHDYDIVEIPSEA